ncbi:MAG TPA: hypothetical protein VGB26_10145 [Nitrospiria bacterium]|jgi:hypothetical protein
MKKEEKPSEPEHWDMKKKAKELLQTGKRKLDDLDSVWGKTKKELQAAMKVIEKGTEKAAEKTISLGKQAGFQSQVYLNQMKLQKSFAELGGRVYFLMRRHSKSLDLEDKKALGMIKKITEMDKNIQELKENVKSSRK